MTPHPGGRPPYLVRLWREMGTEAGEHDRLVKLIILERIGKAILLIALAIAILVLGRTGYITRWIEAAEINVALNSDVGFIHHWVDFALSRLDSFHHFTALAFVLIGYSLLEGAEGVGLAMHRRWAEYLTVLATGLLIPVEVHEVLARPTLLRVGALVLNVAVVAYLAWRKRIFIDV